MARKQTSIPITGEAILRVRDAWKLTQASFAALIGRTREWVSRVEASRTTNMQRGTLEKIAAAMGKTPDETLHILRMVDFSVFEPRYEKVVGAVEIPPMKKVVDDDGAARIIRELAEIPMFDLSLAAGPWMDVVEVPNICGPQSIQQGLFRVRLSGQSMEPKWKNGMIVEFECLKYGVDDAAMGKDYYVQKDDGLATFKRLDSATDEEFILRAINRKKYPDPLIVERKTIVRMALARGEFRPVD